MIGTDMTLVSSPTRRSSRAAVVATAVVTAVVANLVVYGIGRAKGGEYEFTRDGEVMGVDAITVAGFSAVPLGSGLIVVALLARFRWILTLASIVAPLLAVVTIGIMTVPVDLDAVSTAALAACHLTLVPVSVLAVRGIRRCSA